MKKLISICLLVFLPVLCNAQNKNKSKYSELNQDQLNLAFKKSQNTVTTGKVLTFVGLGFAFVGTTLIISAGIKSIDGSDNWKTADAGATAMIIGSSISLIGIPVWIVGGSKKKNIELELAKFKTPGSSSINGIGLKIRF